MLFETYMQNMDVFKDFLRLKIEILDFKIFKNPWKRCINIAVWLRCVWNRQQKNMAEEFNRSIFLTNRLIKPPPDINIQ